MTADNRYWNRGNEIIRFVAREIKSNLIISNDSELSLFPPLTCDMKISIFGHSKAKFTKKFHLSNRFSARTNSHSHSEADRWALTLTIWVATIKPLCALYALPASFQKKNYLTSFLTSTDMWTRTWQNTLETFFEPVKRIRESRWPVDSNNIPFSWQRSFTIFPCAISYRVKTKNYYLISFAHHH